MEPDETESTQELREKTDKSLGEERGKTDEYLEQTSQTVEEETSETIRSIRLAADKDRESQREVVDLDKEHRSDITGIQPSRIDENLLVQERERSDIARAVEREEEDRARTQERVQKQLIAEALLENERKETDNKLLDERVCADLELISRDQFLAIVSHDLQNPLVAISLGAHLIRKDLSKDPVDTASLLENLEIIEQSASSMDRMISDLLDVERMAHDKLVLKPERVNLQDLLQECVNLFAPVVSSKSFSTCDSP